MNQLNLDSVAFEPKRYIWNFLRSNTIKDLIKKNNEIEEEIKVQDHEIQSLVFENYSKFISSIDTVKQMKTDISKVDDKLKSLDQSMDRISQLALKIDSTFAVKRKEIQKLDTINKDLQKLKNLCEFPEVLKADLQQYKALEKSEDKPYQSLFEKSVTYFRECFATLNEYKDEQLIAPIYKESINKVEEMRSILWNLQNQMKTRNSSKDLKSITKKFIIVTEEQISPLRTYFKKAKERLNENCLANQKLLTVDQVISEEEIDIESCKAANEAALAKLRSDSKSFLNQGYWTEFESDFKFISSELLPILRQSEEIEQLINTSSKDAFSFVLNNFCELVNKYCQSSLHFSLILGNAYQYFTSVISHTHSDMLKKQFDKQLREKMEQLCWNHIANCFSRYKMAVLSKATKQKQALMAIKMGEETQKEVYTSINPLKGAIIGNFTRLVVSLQNIKDKEFLPDRRKFLDFMLNQSCELAKLLSYLFSTSSCRISQDIYSLVGHSKQLATQKKAIEEVVTKYRTITDSGVWYLYCHNMLLIIHKTMWPRLISDLCQIHGILQDNLIKQQLDRIHSVSEQCRKAVNKNLCNLSTFYVNWMGDVYKQPETEQMHFSEALKVVEEFVEISAFVFPESRRNIPKKPSLLNTGDRTYSVETEVLLAKKASLFDKRESMTRSALLAIFTKGTLKNWLRQIRNQSYASSKFESEVYCLVQLCYELSSVDEESIISAFFYLIRSEYYRSDGVKVDKSVLDTVYSTQRAKAKF